MAGEGKALFKKRNPSSKHPWGDSRRWPDGGGFGEGLLRVSSLNQNVVGVTTVLLEPFEFQKAPWSMEGEGGGVSVSGRRRGQASWAERSAEDADEEGAVGDEGEGDRGRGLAATSLRQGTSLSEGRGCSKLRGESGPIAN